MAKGIVEGVHDQLRRDAKPGRRAPIDGYQRRQTLVLLVSTGKAPDTDISYRVPSNVVGGDAHDLEVSAGPALQYDKSQTSSWRFGGSGSLTYGYELTPSLVWETSADVIRVASVYTRFDLWTRLVFTY